MQVLNLLGHVFRFSQAKVAGGVQKIFKERNLFYQGTSEMLGEDNFWVNNKGKGVYCGYDPTSDSLHLGNLVSIIMMARLSLHNLKPIFLVGGATGLIGDPSGKTKERTLLSQSIIHSNIQSIQSELTTVYSNIIADISKNHTEYHIPSALVSNINENHFTLRDNYDFYRDMNAIRYLRDVGKYFRMGPLLGKEIVANRLKSDEGISYAEFSYSIIQAYDFYRLYQEQGCVLQFGGSDQWGNITNGCDLIRKKINQEVYGITMPLLLTKSGQKFGKSQGNALFLNPAKTSLQEIHNYFLNCSDEQVQNYLYIFTFYPASKITQIMTQHNLNKQKRLGQNMLSERVISYLSNNWSNKERQYFTLSNEELIKKDQPFFSSLFASMKASNNEYHLIQRQHQGSNLMQVLLGYKLVKSKSEGRREVEKGGFYVNNKRVAVEELNEPLTSFLDRHLIHHQYMLLRWGKKKYQFLHFQ